MRARCLSALALLIVITAAGGADWPIFRGNPLQTGVSDDKLPEQLVVRWKFTVKDAFEGAACIVKDTVYIGCMDEHLYALKLDDGSERWKYKAASFKASPSFKDGAIYIGDSDGILHCVEAATGKKRWTFESNGEISSGVTFAGDTVLFGSGDEHLYCLSKEGKELWKFKVPGGPVLATPAVVGDRTFVAGCDSMLHVIDVAKGKELGSVDIGGQAGATTAIVGDQLYVGTMGNQVLAIEWKKPEIVWKYEAPRRANAFFASAAVTDSLVVVGSRDKRVHAIDRKKGTGVWSFPTEGKVDSSPVIAGQRVFFGSADNHFYELNLAKGTQVLKLDLGAPILASPAVGGGCLVIGTEKGVVYCLGAKK
ncbi:MAG: PQQ-binding-like beta-propeller repeat protein [Gemmataceae bacterium]|nr:PQQ-binding-like beta-propeller repeat protein [Gemmataceae bacterium]